MEEEKKKNLSTANVNWEILSTKHRTIIYIYRDTHVSSIDRDLSLFDEEKKKKKKKDTREGLE